MGLAAIHGRSHSQPLSHRALPVSNAQPKRARAPSDPFLDASPSVSRPVPSPSVNTPTEVEVPSSPFSSYGDDIIGHLGGDPCLDDDDQEEYMRTWSSPDLTNPEILELLKLFPSFVSRRPLPRFPTPPPRQPDIEEGEDDAEGKQIRFGTGSMWVSSKQRSDGWEGSWWSRFILWWKRVFSC